MCVCMNIFRVFVNAIALYGTTLSFRDCDTVVPLANPADGKGWVWATVWVGSVRAVCCAEGWSVGVVADDVVRLARMAEN